MKEELRYDWIDLFRAPRMALSLQKIWMEFPPLFIGYAFYVMCTYLALLNCGDFRDMAATHGLLPCLVGVKDVGILSLLLWILGLAGLFGGALFAATAVARATFLELKGETFFIYRELYAFSFKYLKSTLLGPLGILAVIAGLALCGGVVGLLGRIPVVGVIPVIALSPIWFGVAFFLVVLLVVFAFSVLLAPAVVATLKGDFFEVITETFSITFSQLYRMVWYQLVLLVTTVFSVAVLGAVVKGAYCVMTGILGAGMGAEFDVVKTKTTSVIASWVPTLTCFPESGTDIPAWLGFWGYVLAAVAGLAAFLVVACFGSAVVTAGNTIAYVVIHKIKDEEDLLELEDEEDAEEATKQAAPATTEAAPAADTAPKPAETSKPPETAPAAGDKPSN
jgi:hypothetical protein